LIKVSHQFFILFKEIKRYIKKTPRGCHPYTKGANPKT